MEFSLPGKRWIINKQMATVNRIISDDTESRDMGKREALVEGAGGQPSVPRGGVGGS